MTLEEATRSFKQEVDKFEAFTSLFGTTIAAYDSLIEAVENARKAVKEAANLELTDGHERLLNGVTVRKLSQYTVDPVALRSIPGATDISGLFKPTVDTKVLDAVVRAGVLKKELVDDCRTVPKSTTISVVVL